MFRNLHIPPKSATAEQIAADKLRDERWTRALEPAQASESEAPTTLQEAREADQKARQKP